MASSPFDPARLLLNAGKITKAPYDEARTQKGDTTERLVEAGFVSEHDANRARAQSKANERGFAYADLERVRIDLAATLSLPSDLARELGAVPLKLDGKTLWVAVRDPHDRQALTRAEEASGCRVIPVVAEERQIESALERF